MYQTVGNFRGRKLSHKFQGFETINFVKVFSVKASHFGHPFAVFTINNMSLKSGEPSAPRPPCLHR